MVPFTLDDRNPDQNPVNWHVFLCFAFPGNRRSPQQSVAKPLDNPAGLTGLLLNWTDTINQFGFHYISFQDSVLGAATGYAGVRALHEIQLYRSGRTGIGLGDAKFLAALGAWFGWQSLPFLLVGSSLIMLTVYFRRREKPFGVGLSITALGILGIRTFGSG